MELYLFKSDVDHFHIHPSSITACSAFRVTGSQLSIFTLLSIDIRHNHAQLGITNKNKHDD